MLSSALRPTRGVGCTRASSEGAFREAQCPELRSTIDSESARSSISEIEAVGKRRCLPDNSWRESFNDKPCLSRLEVDRGDCKKEVRQLSELVEQLRHELGAFKSEFEKMQQQIKDVKQEGADLWQREVRARIEADLKLEHDVKRCCDGKVAESLELSPTNDRGERSHEESGGARSPQTRPSNAAKAPNSPSLILPTTVRQQEKKSKEAKALDSPHSDTRQVLECGGPATEEDSCTLEAEKAMTQSWPKSPMLGHSIRPLGAPAVNKGSPLIAPSSLSIERDNDKGFGNGVNAHAVRAEINSARDRDRDRSFGHAAGSVSATPKLSALTSIALMPSARATQHRDHSNGSTASTQSLVAPLVSPFSHQRAHSPPTVAAHKVMPSARRSYRSNLPS